MSTEKFREKEGDRLFIGAYPTGYVYADRFVEVSGDYKRLGYISYEKLELEMSPGAKSAPVGLVAEMKEHAAGLQAQRGVRILVGGNMGVPLGGKCLHTLAQARRLNTLPDGYLTPINVMSRSLWELERMPPIHKIQPTPGDGEMIRVIVTKCGRKLHRTMKAMDDLGRDGMRNALVGAGTDDDEGKYVEIAKVYFILPNTEVVPDQNYAGTVLHWAARFGCLDQVPSELLTPEALGATAWGGLTVTEVAIASGHVGQLPSMAESLPGTPEGEKTKAR